MTTEYIAKIKGDTSQLEQVLKKVQGKMKKLEDDEVLIKLDYDGNVKQFNKVFDQVLKACPDLTIQFQYDVNKKLLDKEVKKLETLEDIKIGIDSKDFSKNLDNKIKDIKNSVSNNASSDSIAQQIKDLFKYANTAKELGAKIGRDLSEKLAEALMDTKAEDILDDILDKVDVSKLSLFKVTGKIDEEISKAKENVKDLNEYMNLLTSKGASKNGKGSTELEALQEEVKILKSDLSDMKDELQNISGEQFDQMTQSVKETTDQLNLALEKIKEIQQTLNANDMGIKLTDVVNTWRQEKESKSRERYTAFNSESLSTSGVHIAAEADGVGEKLIREAISEMSGKATGFIHSHPNKKAAFSDTDIEAYYKLASEGITEQIVTSFNESMSLNMDNVDLNKSDEVIKIIQKKYKEIDDKWLNNLELSTEEIKEKITPLLNAKTDDPVFNAVIRTIRDNFDDLMDGVTNLDEFSEVMEENADYILKQIPQFREKSVAERNEIITKVAGFSDLLHDAVLGGVVENLQGEYQKVLLDVFTDKRFLKEGAKSAIKVMPIAEFLDAKSIADVIEESVKTAEKTTEKAQDSGSPSKVAEKLGEYWGIGYANGIKKHKSDIKDAIRELVKTGILTAEDLQKDLDTILSGGLGKKYKDLINPLQNILKENSSNSYENKSLRELLELYHQIGINNDSDEELNKISEALLNIVQSQKKLDPSQLQKFVDVLRGLRTKEKDFIPIINEIYSVENAIKILERLQGVNKTSPTQTFDNEIQQNLIMLENYENTIKEINRLSELGLNTDEAKKKLEELNKLADYFAAQITVIQSENGNEVNRSMMYFNGIPNPHLMSSYKDEDIKRFTRVADERSGLNRRNVSSEFQGIEQEIKDIEFKSNGLLEALKKGGLRESEEYISKVRAALIGLIETKEELAIVKPGSKDALAYHKDIDHYTQKFPEILQFYDKLSTYDEAKEFVKTDEWMDFLATLPQAHVALEALGYDFEKINRPIENTEERIITLKAEEQQAEATAQAEKKVAEARQEASTPTTSNASGGSASDTTTSSIQILTEEELQKELTKVRETIDKEKAIIKELEDELSIEVPKAIKKKNEEFDEEVKKVREDIDKEKAILSELKEYLDTTIPEAIDVKNNKFNEEVGKVKQAIDEEIGHLDRFRSELEKPISIDIQKDNEDTFDDSYAFSEAMDRFAKKQQAQHQRKLDNLTALTSQLKAKNDARDEEKELQGVKDLDNALEEVIKKINLKITAFSHEEDRIKDISRNEAIALQEIINKLETIKTLATDMKSAFQGIKVDGKIDIKGIKDILQFEGKDFTTVANSLKSLFDALNELKLGDKSFIKQLDSILAKGKELDNLVKVLKTSEKKIAQAKENVKTDKEKNREDSYKKELELEKQKLALEKEYQLLEAKGDSKAEETKAKNLIKINQLEKERKQIVDSRKKGETSKDLRNQINNEIKAIRERNEADIQAEKAAKEVHDQKQRRADKEKAWNTAEKKFNDEKAKAVKEAAEAEAKATKEAEKAKIEAEKKASQEAKNAERIRKESLEESYGMQKALMKEASDLAIRNLALSDSESEFDIKEIANNNERIAEIGKQINDIVEKRNKLDSDSITLHRELLNYQEELNRDYQTQFDLRDRNKATEHNEDAIAAYKELIKTANEYYNLQINTLGKDDNNPDVIRLKELIDKWEEARKAKEEYNDFSVNKEGSNKSIQGLKEVEEQFANIEAQVSAKIRESLVKELPKYTKMLSENKYIDEVSDAIARIKKNIEDIDNNGLNLADTSDVQRVHQIREDIAFINSEKGLSKYKAASETRIKQLQLQIRQFQNNNSAMGKTFKEQFDNLFDQFSAAKSIAEVDELKGKFTSLEAEVVKAGKTGKNFFKTFVEHLKSTNAQLLATYFSFQDLLRYARTAFETVRQLDTALVDLKKTTTMNNTELEEFYKNSNKIAKQMGVTTQEIINQASSWSRLGFSSKEASETMAQLSSQFASISPGMSTDEAQTGLVSLIKAWDIDVKDVERELMDNINVLGNKFALTNKDIIEGMERAGATLSVIGTSVQDSFALFTGAQEVIQNAESVGTALKTLSLRIRGKQSLPPYMVTYMLCSLNIDDNYIS